MYTLKDPTCTDDAVILFQQQVLKGPCTFALLVYSCWRGTHFTWSTLCSFQTLIAEPQPPRTLSSPGSVFLLPPLLGVFFTSKVPANISPGPWTWCKAYCGSEHGDSHALSCVGPAVISLKRAGWFASIQCGPPALTARAPPLTPALAQKARCYLRWDAATAVGSSSSELLNCSF